jgi:tight adherence protein C
MSPAVLLCAFVAFAGVGLMVAAIARSQHAGPDIGAFLPAALVHHNEFDEKLAEPFLARFLQGARHAISTRVERLVPRNYLDKLESQLSKAGLTGRWRAGDQLAVQLVLAIVGVGAALMVPTGSPALHLGVLVLLPVMGFMLPSAHLKRKIQARSDAIFKDLPDIVDMLAIAVEAGSGFEAAVSLVCENFDSPFAEELSFALKEMELGLPRREALQQLRDRVDLDVVRTFVLALLQADALGIPVGRILKAQATEVRARRRSWAREKAAKLPIKIMFPLVLFIFPPIMALVIGPAALSFGKLS